MKVKIEYLGQHQPSGIYEVDEEKVERLVSTGVWHYGGSTKDNQVFNVKSGVPDESWTEKEIKKWIEDKKLPIKYDIVNKSKKWVLEQLKKHGFA